MNQKPLLKHISCKFKCKFGCRKFNSNQKCNNNKCRCECRNQKQKKQNKKTIDYIWNTGVCSCENGKYFSNIIDISVTTCD